MAREKKEVKREERKRNPEAFGIAGFTLGIVSIVMILFDPMVGFLISLVGIFLSLKQQRMEKTRRGKVGMILNVIGLVANVAMFLVVNVWLSPIINQVYMQQLNNTLVSP